MVSGSEVSDLLSLLSREHLPRFLQGVKSKLSWPPKMASTDWIPLANTSVSDCDHQNHLKYIFEVTTLAAAAVIIVLLNVVQPRSKARCRPSTLWGLLDVVTPVRLLGGTTFRYMYCIIMGCWGANVIHDLFDTSLYFRSSNDLLDAFTYFVNSFAVIILKEALLYFPVLACVDAPVRVLGYCIGFIYTLMLGVYKVDIEAVLIMGCSYFGQQTNKEIGVSLAVHVPIYLNYIVIAVWFFCHAAMEITLIIFTGSSIKSHVSSWYSEQTGHVNHVKTLLRKPERPKLITVGYLINIKNLWTCLVRGFKFVLPFQSSFIYPLPFVAGLYMSLMIIYQLIVYVMYREVTFANNLMDFITGFNITVETIKEIFPELSYKLDNLFYDAKSYAEAYLIILPFGTAIAFGLCMFFVMYMTQSFHKQLRKAYRGDISSLVKSEPLPSPAYRLVATMRFSAFLVSHIVFTWMLYSFMMVSLFSVGLLFYYLFKDARRFGIHLWAWFMIPMMWSAGMHQLQLVLCRYIFYDRSGGNGLIKIRYKRIYDVLTYVFFFFNVIFGVVMCFLRVFGVFMFTMVMLFRLDWDVYMRGLEGWDTGNRTYVGYMYTEVTYNNAVVRVFVQVLQDSIYGKRQLSLPQGRLHQQTRGRNRIASDSSKEDEKQPLLMNGSTRINYSDNGSLTSSYNFMTVRSPLVRNRWLVAYTLIRNPSLQELRAGRLREEGKSNCMENQLESSVFIDDNDINS